MWGIIQDAVKKHLAPLTQGLWESVLFWRTLALLLLVFLMVGYFLRGKLRSLLLRPGRRNHDTQIFERSDAIMSEAQLSSCLTNMWNSHHYQSQEGVRLLNFQQFFAQVGNGYLDQRISRTLRPLLHALSQLTDFTARHFFPHPNPGLDVYCLYPELRGAAGGQADNFYQQHAAELERTLKPVEDRYQEYRRAVKKQLLK